MVIGILINKLFLGLVSRIDSNEATFIHTRLHLYSPETTSHNDVSNNEFAILIVIVSCIFLDFEVILFESGFIVALYSLIWNLVTFIIYTLCYQFGTYCGDTLCAVTCDINSFLLYKQEYNCN